MSAIQAIRGGPDVAQRHLLPLDLGLPSAGP